MGRYDPCQRCRSFAKNPDSHGRIEGKYPDLCDVCYWRAEAETEKAERDALKNELDMADACLDMVREWLAKYPEYIDMDGVPAMMYPEACQAIVGKRSKQLSDEIEKLKDALQWAVSAAKNGEPVPDFCYEMAGIKIEDGE